MTRHPVTIKVVEAMSYFHTGFSPRYIIERSVLIKMPVAVDVESKTILQKGITITWPVLPIARRPKPVRYVFVQYGLIFF